MKNDFHNTLLNNISFANSEGNGNRRKQLQMDNAEQNEHKIPLDL